MHYEKFQDGTVKCIEDEIPFELPEGWSWTRLGSLFSTITGSTPSTKDASLYGDEYPFYKPTDLDAGFDEFVTAWQNAGGTTIVEEVNDWYKSR